MKDITVHKGGQDSTECLLDSLQSKYPNTDLSLHAREIKEIHSFAALNPQQETVAETANLLLRRTYELPSKLSIDIIHERALCIEPIFGSIKSGKCTLAKFIKQLIQYFPEFSNQLAANIILCGSPTECKNFNYRLLSELYKCKAAKVVRVYCPPQRPYLSWVGASAIYFDDDYVDVGVSLGEYKSKNVRNEQ